MNIAIYSRKSKYSEKGESIDNQIQFCKEFAQIHFSQISEKKFILYEDEGYSAANTCRPQFQKLLNDIKQKKINLLLCYRLDRITRNVSDFSRTLDTLEKYDVPFVSATENFDTSTPLGKAMIYIASVFAQLERETTAERVKDNMLALSRTGRWLGGLTPLGYESEALLFLDENYKERRLYNLIPVESDLGTVKILFHKYMELKSLSRVEQYCLANYLKTRKYCNFTKSSIAQILENPTYCIADNDAYQYFKSLGCIIANDPDDFNNTKGILCYNRTCHPAGKKQKKRPPAEWIIAIGKHEGIITGKDYSLVQKMIHINKSKGSPRSETSGIALLSGKINCSICGSRLRIKNIRRKSNKIFFSYACEMKVLSKGTRCCIQNIPGNQLDSEVLKLIRSLLLNKATTDYIPYLKQKETLIYSVSPDNSKKYTLLQDKESRIKNDIHTLLNQLTQKESSLTLKYILPKLDELDKNLLLIQNEIKEMSPDKMFKESKERIEAYYLDLSDFNNLFKDTDLRCKKEILDCLIERIDWDGKDVYITLKTK